MDEEIRINRPRRVRLTFKRLPIFHIFAPHTTVMVDYVAYKISRSDRLIRIRVPPGFHTITYMEGTTKFISDVFVKSDVVIKVIWGRFYGAGFNAIVTNRYRAINHNGDMTDRLLLSISTAVLVLIGLIIAIFKRL